MRDDPRWKMTYHHYCYYYHLAPHEKPWSFCVLNAGPGPVSLVCTTRVGGCLEKGCATCSGLGGRRGRGGGRWWWWGPLTCEGQQEGGRALLGPPAWLVWRDQGRPVRAMARPARASWCTHTAILSLQLPTAQTFHIRRPVQFLNSKPKH